MLAKALAQSSTRLFPESALLVNTAFTMLGHLLTCLPSICRPLAKGNFLQQKFIQRTVKLSLQGEDKRRTARISLPFRLQTIHWRQSMSCQPVER